MISFPKIQDGAQYGRHVLFKVIYIKYLLYIYREIFLVYKIVMNMVFVFTEFIAGAFLTLRGTYITVKIQDGIQNGCHVVLGYSKLLEIVMILVK